MWLGGAFSSVLKAETAQVATAMYRIAQEWEREFGERLCALDIGVGVVGGVLNYMRDRGVLQKEVIKFLRTFIRVVEEDGRIRKK